MVSYLLHRIFQVLNYKNNLPKMILDYCINLEPKFRYKFTKGSFEIRNSKYEKINVFI